MEYYKGLKGNIYQLNNVLGQGGEGVVYDLLNDSTRVAKIYKADHFKSKKERDTMERKLKTMLSMKLTGYVDNLFLFTWPMDILYDSGTMVGFIMPRVSSNLKIFSICRIDKSVKAAYPDFTWKYSVQFAYNLAVVVQYLHSKGIIVGDLNQNNIFVDSHTSAVILIDCDSFDILDASTGEHFPCTVGFSEILAPELQQVGNMKNGRFTKESDDFSLAIHIFRLLMNNSDPFGGIMASGRSLSGIPANQAIINGECQYVRDVGKKLPETSPKFEAMPPEIQRLFIKTFDYNALTNQQRISRRATADEWVKALYPYAYKEPNPNLITCKKNRHHVYPAHNISCPWCVCKNYMSEWEIKNSSPKPFVIHNNQRTSSQYSKANRGSYSYGQQRSNVPPTPKGFFKKYGFLVSAAVVFMLIFMMGGFLRNLTNKEDKEIMNNYSGETAKDMSISSTEEVVLNVSPSQPSGNYKKLVFAEEAKATSVLDPESSEIYYDPERAIDGDIITSWQEGADGDGSGESLTVIFTQIETVNYICLYPGNWRDTERFYNNNRPKTMLISAGGAEYEVSFPDGMICWYIVFSNPIETDKITFQTTSVYRGTVSNDLCISEVIAYGS